MPSNVTDYGENYFLGMLIGGYYSKPTSFYMALLTAAPIISDDGTTVSEPPSASGYARVNFNNDATFWASPSGGAITNTGTIAFPQATADWPSVTHYAFMDALTGGNMYLYSTLQLPRVVQSGHLCKFDPGQLTMVMQGARQPVLASS